MQLTRNPVVRSVLSAAVLGLVLAGCSDTPGTPTAATTTTATATEDTDPTTTSAAAGGDLADFDPCAELEAVASSLGVTEVEEDGVQECKGRYAGTISVRVKAFPELGVEDYVPGPNSKISGLPIGGHQAKRVTAPASSSSCAVTVAITSSSRVDFVASANASLDEACEAATKVATAVEPKLPK
ncbi:DUF3558 family protein [Saccharothrix sp. 6-C]|uniref:DUF3558 family protein n=1 Tax=Saccharothrix sp. 6-C TaxID=2781735 RepID=UPI00191723B3|nr:DUF3558 family protein [Saccharothrix sp. 6-C]QQQ76174.1 DUF3558 family protein [Saccharothrix sp. 6-C]